MSEKIFSAGYRAPAPVDGLNVNFCKNPKCKNFGVPETPHRKRRAAGAAPQPGDYTLVAAGRGKPQLKCSLCGETLPMHSNQSIQEELARITSYLKAAPEPACTNRACTMFGVPLSAAGDSYVRFGASAAGTPRWRCSSCKKTFSGQGKSTKKQRMAHKNREVFALLISKVPLRRMAWLTQMDRRSLYGKIAFLHAQCRAFLGERESRLPGMALPKLYLATDRQTLAVNWSNRRDRRCVMLQAIATADLTSGYVFGMDLNFDPSLDLGNVSAEAARMGERDKPQPYRRFARLWLRSDYEEAMGLALGREEAKRAGKTLVCGPDPLGAAIARGYEDAVRRDDIEEAASLDAYRAPPVTGVEVRNQYTVYAHFLALARLVGHASKVRCYLDQDSGFRAAFMAAFHAQVKQRRADAWFVRVMKEATVDQKKAAVFRAKQRLARAMALRAGDGVTPREVEIQLTLAEMKRMESIGKWGDRWLVHPAPTMAEPDKRVCWLTDIDSPETSPDKREEQLRHAARLYLRGSLHAIDRFFMRVRRSLTLAERPYATASANRQMWYGYSAYQPQNLAMALTIFKVAYNYCLPNSKGKTPAMQLGLARAPVALEDIIYFRP